MGAVKGLAEEHAALAAHGLPSRFRLAETALDDDAWVQLLGWVRDERLIGILASAVAERALPVTSAQREAVSHKHAEAMALSVMLERVLLEVGARLERCEIPYVVLKGPTVAHTAYPDPSMRYYGDIDLLLQGADIGRTVTLLLQDGCRRPYPEIRPGFDRRFGKSVTLVRPDGIELDLHRTFVPGRFGLSVCLDGLFETALSLEIGARCVPMLGMEERVLAACYNAALGDPEPCMMTLRDIAQMLLHPALQEGRVRELAQAWRAEAVLARAICLSWDALGLVSSTELSEWGMHYRPSHAEERAVASYTTARSATAQTLSALGAVHGLRDKAALIGSVVVPNRGYLERHGPDPRRYVHWWRRGARSMRKAMSRS